MVGPESLLRSCMNLPPGAPLPVRWLFELEEFGELWLIFSQGALWVGGLPSTRPGGLLFFMLHCVGLLRKTSPSCEGLAMAAAIT